MKLNKLILPIFALSLISCSNTLPSDSNIDKSSNIDTSDITSNTISEVSSDDNDSYSSLSTNAFNNATTGGILVDIIVGAPLVINRDYNFTISSKDVSATGDYSVILSNPEVVSYEYINNSHTLHSKKVGQSIITIKDSNDSLIFRNIITVVKPVTEDNVYDYLIDTDYFESKSSYYDSYKVTFLSNSEGIIQGKESSSSFGSINFTYSYSKYRSDVDAYIFNVTVDSESNFDFVEFDVLSNRYAIALYGGSDGLITLVHPVNK